MNNFNSDDNDGGLNINFDDIQAEVNNILGVNQQNLHLSHSEVFDQILDSLDTVDFRQEANLSVKERVGQKVYLVVTVRKVLEATENLNVGLCRNGDFIYIYNGEYWRLIPSAELEVFLGRAANKLGVDDITADFHLFRASLVKQFLTVAYLPKPEKPIGTVLINFKNGTLQINGMYRVLRQPQRSDFITYQLPFFYDENAQCPKWMDFLNRVLPDITRQRILAEYLGYIFTDLKLEKTLYLFGDGANGKSVVFDVTKELLGPENISHFSINSLTENCNRACLTNKLLNYSSEISTRLESDIFKKLTSGEPVEARLLYGQPFIMRNYAKLAFNCNELPRDIEHNEAFFRRFLIIPFDEFIPEGERNPNLAKEIIGKELPGVFNWVMGGLERLVAQGNFSPCQAARMTLDNYRRESDSVTLFIEESGYEKALCQEEATLLKDLYPQYRAFCMENGFRPLNSTHLRKRLEALGFETTRINLGRLIYVKNEEKFF